MKKDSEIKLDNKQKELLKMLLYSGYTTLKYGDGFGLYATGVTDHGENKALLLSGIVEPNAFDWVKEDEPCEIAKLLNKPYEPETVWDLKDGDEYWWVISYGEVSKDTWNDYCTDYKRRNQGNAFLTKEEAKFEVKRREMVTRLRKHTRPFKVGGENWTPYWSHTRKSIDFNCVSEAQEAQLYFESKEKIKQAIAEVGEEDFKKYYLGVTE